MTEIDAIMGMLDWNNSAEEQAAGLAQAAQVENFQVFLQPCTEHYNKNVWDNCAKALAMRSDAELDACLENLLAWLRDMNWPGAFLVSKGCRLFRTRRHSIGRSRKAFCARRRLGTRYGRRISENCKIVKTRYLHRMRGDPTCAKLIWNWIIVPNANRRKRRTHFLHRNTAFLTHLQRSCSAQNAERVIFHRPNRE